MNPTLLTRSKLLTFQEQVNLQPLMPAATRALSAALDAPITLQPYETFEYQAHILRCQVLSSDSRIPTSVIIKQAKNRGGQQYNPNDGAFWSLAYRLFNDWAGAQFLSSLDWPAQFGPRFYAGSREEGFIMLEDLGNNASVHAALLANEPLRAEMELLNVSACLGQMHAATANRYADFVRLRDALGPRDPAMYPKNASYLRNSLPQLRELLIGVGLPAHERFYAEAEALAIALTNPEPFSAYTNGDPCPVNWLNCDSTLRLIDFEFGGFEHAPTEAMHGRMVFPTYAFAQRIPQKIIERMEVLYRSELMRGCPAAADDALFQQAIAQACAFWLLFSLVRDLKPAFGSRDAEAKTACQWVVARSQEFVAAAERAGYFPEMRSMANRLIEKLVEVWSAEAYELPYFPAFQGTI